MVKGENRLPGHLDLRRSDGLEPKTPSDMAIVQNGDDGLTLI
jgi:hypothetical protein